jgi:hypothetical protein
MDSKGDTQWQWDRETEVGLKESKQVFEKHFQGGFLAYMIDQANEGTVIREFDPEAEKIVMVPPMAGG